MDTTMIATIASATVSLLVPYLKSVGEEFAKKVGEETGETAWNKAKLLWDAVKAKFSTKPETDKVISTLEKVPDDPDTQAVVRFHLKDMMIAEEYFAKQLAEILKQASNAGADTVFNTSIFGDVEKLVQMGNVYGDVKI